MSGMNWQVISGEPVIAPGQLHGELDAKRAGACHVIKLGDVYRIYYWATDADGFHHVCEAEAPVGKPNDWRFTRCVLGRQPGSDHNDVGPSFPFMLPVDQKRWLLYCGCWGKGRPDGKLPNTTTVAVSEDGGKTFDYAVDEPMIPLDRPYDQSGTGSVWVLHERGLFRMYYTSLGAYSPKPDGVRTGHGDVIPRIGIAYAESDDGITWRKPLDDLMVSPRGFGVEPYEYIASKPCILVDRPPLPPGEGWGEGTPGRSDAPEHPRQSEEPSPGSLRSPPSPRGRGQLPRYTLWVNTFGTAYRVHHLTSSDGSNWQWAPRVGPHGEMGTGEPGSFDDHQRSYPTVVREGDELRCWYTGNGFGATGIGYAVHRLTG